MQYDNDKTEREGNEIIREWIACVDGRLVRKEKRRGLVQEAINIAAHELMSSPQTEANTGSTPTKPSCILCRQQDFLAPRHPVD